MLPYCEGFHLPALFIISHDGAKYDLFMALLENNELLLVDTQATLLY